MCRGCPTKKSPTSWTAISGLSVRASFMPDSSSKLTFPTTSNNQPPTPMNPDPDKPQDDLQKMLALKRHETPPPRFFTGFSDKVIDGLREPDTGPRTIWQRLGLDIDSRPVLVCASGVVVCG